MASVAKHAFSPKYEDTQIIVVWRWLITARAGICVITTQVFLHYEGHDPRRGVNTIFSCLNGVELLLDKETMRALAAQVVVGEHRRS